MPLEINESKKPQEQQSNEINMILHVTKIKIYYEKQKQKIENSIHNIK
jgi:hypothetical protein